MAANVTLLVMDETFCDQTDVFALVGLLVPIEKADPIRLQLHSFMRRLANQGRLVQPPPEIHGKDMLKGVRWAKDKHKCKCFEFVVRLVKKHRLSVVRKAYYLKPLMKSLPAFKDMSADVRYGFCRRELIEMVSPLLARNFLLPIMDGIDPTIAKILGGFMPMLHALRSHRRFNPNSMTPDLHRLMDPMFVDSRHFSLIQVADVMAYLLHIRDWVSHGLPLSGPFKPRVAAIAQTIDMTLVLSPPIVEMKSA